MDANYLNRFFTKKYMFSKIKDENLQPEKFLNNVSQNYLDLNRKYRNEFFYKSTLFNKIVLGRYSLNTTVAYSEIAISKSKADFVLINKNKGIVYEIKTDLDNMERLVFQVLDYSQAFSEIFVVTSERNYYPVYKVLKEADVNVGIIVLNTLGQLSVRKKSIMNDEKLKHEVLFKLLRKSEYESILKLKFNQLPEVKQVEYFKESLKWFRLIDIKEAQKMVFQQLWNRKTLKSDKLLKKIPMELRWLIYQECSNEQDIKEILKRLKVE